MCGTMILGALGLILAAKLATCGVRRRWAYMHGYGPGGGCHGRFGGHGMHGGCGGPGGRWGGGYGRWSAGPEDERGEGEGHGPHGHHHRHGGRGGFARGMGKRWMLRWLSERLDATPGQEKVIAAALEAMEKTVHEAKGSFEKSRSTIADALRGEEFGHDKIGEAWVSHDNAFEKVRMDLVTELQKIHDALDEKQRKILADLVESGGFWG